MQSDWFDTNNVIGTKGIVVSTLTEYFAASYDYDTGKAQGLPSADTNRLTRILIEAIPPSAPALRFGATTGLVGATTALLGSRTW